jgi:hypothetical protein
MTMGRWPNELRDVGASSDRAAGECWCRVGTRQRSKALLAVKREEQWAIAVPKPITVATLVVGKGMRRSNRVFGRCLRYR